MKPMLACNWNENKVVFPVVVQPKIDGVRGLNTTGRITGRSLKEFANVYISWFFSHDLLKGFDGEFAAGPENHPELCRMTTSALNTYEGKPFLLWWVFDYIPPTLIDAPYSIRLDALEQKVKELQSINNTDWAGLHLRVIPSKVVHNMEELLAFDAEMLEQGFEGTIIRALNGKHKQGRSTVREGGLLRIKRFTDAEAIVVSITEGNRNDNEAQTNELGHTFRTSHQENKFPNGMVGNLICKDITTGDTITVSAGKLSHDERLHYFQNQNEIIGKTIKYQHFVHGKKDKPRFPTFQCFRMQEDM